MADDRLRLSAVDADDLAVIAACAQDALVPIGEMAFLPAEQRFVLALNRFRWDRLDAAKLAVPGDDRQVRRPKRDAAFLEPGDQGPGYERVHSGLCFEDVTAVRTKGIDLRNRERILELLTIQVEAREILLIFAGGAVIQLEITALRCYLEDFGDSWPTRWRPHHRDGAVGDPQR